MFLKVDFTQIQRGTIELLAKMFAYIGPLAINNEGRLLLHCIIHFLTHRQLCAITELSDVTVEYEKQRLFLTSEQANYQNKNQQSTIDNNAGLNQDLLESLEIFLIGVANQFQQPQKNDIRNT